MNGFFVHDGQALLSNSNCCLLGPFFVWFIGLLSQELKEKFITSTIARYSLQQNKPIVRKFLYNLRKESILEIFWTVLCDI